MWHTTEHAWPEKNVFKLNWGFELNIKKKTQKTIEQDVCFSFNEKKSLRTLFLHPHVP